MQITLRLSRFNDLDLYAYFMGVEYRRSTLIKQLLRDYIRQEHTVRLKAPDISAHTFTDPAIEKQIVIPVTLGKSDDDIIEYLSDCPNRMRGKCVKSVLRMMLAPYTQCAYHFSPVTPYAPYCDRAPIAQSPVGTDMTQLLALLLGQGLQREQVLPIAAAKPSKQEPEFCQPTVLPQMPAKLPVTQTDGEEAFGRMDHFPISMPIPETKPALEHTPICREEAFSDPYLDETNDESVGEREAVNPMQPSVEENADSEDVPPDDALLALFGVDY